VTRATDAVDQGGAEGEVDGRISEKINQMSELRETTRVKPRRRNGEDEPFGTDSGSSRASATAGGQSSLSEVTGATSRIVPVRRVLPRRADDRAGGAAAVKPLATSRQAGRPGPLRAARGSAAEAACDGKPIRWPKSTTTHPYPRASVGQAVRRSRSLTIMSRSRS